MALTLAEPLRAGSACFHVTERSQVGEARRHSVLWAESQGCEPDLQSKLALVVSELAANLSLHTSAGGMLLLRLVENRGAEAIEIQSLDAGPGRSNFGACLEDGYSTAGTAGTGLGAVSRASESFQVHSQPGIGTALYCIISLKTPGAEARWQHGLVNVPIKGETECGDAAAFIDLGRGRARLLVADGLGHGPNAAEASGKAVEVFKANPEMDFAHLLETMHGAMRTTRGAAVAMAEVDVNRDTLVYSGVGNIAGCIVSPGAEGTHLVSMNGTLGVVKPTLQKFQYPWRPDALLVMTSDGIKNHWRLDRYAGLMTRHPSLIAGVLFRDHGRRTDDMTVATLRFS